MKIREIRRSKDSPHDDSKAEKVRRIFENVVFKSIYHQQKKRILKNLDKTDKIGYYEAVINEYNQFKLRAQKRRFAMGKPRPFPNLASSNPIAEVEQVVTFDASNSIDCDKMHVKEYIFDFGDGNKSKHAERSKPIAKHAYTQTGTFPVTITVT
eukprot:375831_1